METNGTERTAMVEVTKMAATIAHNRNFKVAREKPRAAARVVTSPERKSV